MKPKMKIKMGIDFLMTVLLLLLMAYQITGQELHEWFGVGMLRRLWGGKKTPAVFIWLIRFIAIFIAGYGAYSFHKENIASYMFLKQEFVFFDFEQSAVSVFAKYIAMMGLWVFIGFYAVKGLRKITSLKKQRKEMRREED